MFQKGNRPTLLDRSREIAKKHRRTSLVYVAGGNGEGEDDDFMWNGLDAITVEIQKQIRDYPCRSLVAIDKRMVSSNAEQICRGQSERVGFSVAMLLLGPRQGRFQHALIAQTRRTTVKA